MTGRPTTYADNGMVASPHYLASQAGLRILQQGGNAVDAAIATNATLNVVLPHQCHVGGDLFALVYDPATKQVSGLNASGPAPAGESIERLNQLGHVHMPERGALAVTVPGTVAGWWELSQRYGAREFGHLLEPATQYAADGFPVSDRLAAGIQLLRAMLESNAGTREIFVREPALRGGDRLSQPALARTFQTIADKGRDGFYGGSVGEDIVTTLQQAESAITLEDLESYQPEWLTPIQTQYRDVTLLEMPANSQGPAAILAANIAEGWNLSNGSLSDGDSTHLLVEAIKIALDDRDELIADPRFAEVPERQFIDKDYAANRRRSIDPERAASGSMRADERGDTVYLCVVDRDGMAVSLIQSLYEGFGSGVLASRSGVLFHNRGKGFSLDPDHPNRLQPGKRPKHTLIPAMLLRDGLPEVVFGTMGADGQAQTQLQLLTGLIDFNLSPQQAIEMPRWRSAPDGNGGYELLVEPGIGSNVIKTLRDKGHKVEVCEPLASVMGHAQMIKIDRERGILAGAADPRGDGIAAGW